MSCCKSKFVVGAAVVGLSVAALVATGWGEVAWNRITAKVKKQIPPEAQLERVKGQIAKLDQDIDKNWEPIAKYEREIRELKVDLKTRQDKVAKMEKELAVAADELEKNSQYVTYDNKKFSRPDAIRVLERETRYFSILKRDVASKEKLLAAREQKLKASMENQEKMRVLRGELMAKTEQIEADLQLLQLARTESKLPTGDQSRLDDIKSTLRDLENYTSDQMRVLELKNSHRDEAVVTPEPTEKTDATDSVVRRIRSAIGESSVAKDE